MAGFQWGWRFCSKCATMFWNDPADGGVCPRGDGHDAHGFLFGLPFDRPAEAARINGFFYCNKCHCVFLEKDLHPGHASGSTLGRCPKGDRHDPAGSFEFVLNVDRPQANGQRPWFVCTRCNCLYFGPEIGTCARDADGDSGVVGHASGGFAADEPIAFKIEFSDRPADWID